MTRIETLAWFRAEIERHRHLTDTVRRQERSHAGVDIFQDAIETQLKVIRREAKQVLP